MDLFSVEFYVIMFTVAALAVGFIARPGQRHPAQTWFATPLTLDRETDITPRIEFRCLNNGDIALIRHGLTGLTTAATIALAITRTGSDISIEERITPGYGGETVERATFIIEGLGQTNYHVTYNSAAMSLFAATSLTNRPGNTLERPLTHA